MGRTVTSCACVAHVREAVATDDLGQGVHIEADAAARSSERRQCLRSSSWQESAIEGDVWLLVSAQHVMNNRACSSLESSILRCRRLAVSQRYAVLSSNIFATYVVSDHVSPEHRTRRACAALLVLKLL